jgi:methionyl-tRNA synthetase
MTEDKVSLEEFKKLDLRVAQIKNAEEIPNKDKLLKLTIDLGEETRTIVAGIKPYFPKEELIDKQIIVITNLKPAILGGVESNGMLLAAGSPQENTCVLLTTEKPIKPGSKIN